MTEKGDIIIGRALPDWVRLTTFEFSAVERLITERPDVKRVTKRQNYRGQLYDGVWVGRGNQLGKAHWMAECTGDDAARNWRKLPEGMKCTRIDIQVTLKVPWHAIAEMAQELRAVPWKGRQRQLRLISNDNREDTLYIGARQSHKYIRIYAKGTPSNQIVRFEIEYKGAMAVAVWETLHDGTLPGEIVAAEIWDIPHVESSKPFETWAASWDTAERYSFPVPATKRAWVESTCFPALWKAARSHSDTEWLYNELVSVVHFLENKG